MNTTTKAPAPRFTVGQRVEVLAHDFTLPGQPLTWQAATVTAVEARGDKMWDVQVRADGGAWHPQIVGVRGGNKRVRAL